MKLGIIILVILGVVAAACAAMLVGILRTDSSRSAGKNSAEIEVATAKVSMPAMTVLTLDHIVEKEVAKQDLPEGRLISPSQAIGKVLAMPVVKGQVLTDSCFVTEGSGAHLAAALPYGMRAVSVTLSTKAIPDEMLLYPGCVVDVLVSFRLSSSDRSKGQAISTTMLRGIQVLAVAGESVVSKPNTETKIAKQGRGTGGAMTVTLMVDPKQAEALQLASDNGNIALTIRNPLDKNQVDLQATILSQGRLASLGSVLTPAVFSSAEIAQALLTKQQDANSVPQEHILGDDSDTNSMPEQPRPEEQYKISEYPRWGITVIRGRQATLEELDIPASESAPVSRAKN
jgi:pilus assembly protein CpaB